jgi:hypothetical protein
MDITERKRAEEERERLRSKRDPEPKGVARWLCLQTGRQGHQLARSRGVDQHGAPMLPVPHASARSFR